MFIDLPEPGCGPALALWFGPIESGGPAIADPAEMASLPPKAVALRRREFAAGRRCAAAAMRALGLQPRPVAIAADRSPVWPGGLVGSISHDRTLAGAAIALRSGGIRAIGLDLEEADPLADDLIGEVCSERERGWLDAQHPGRRGLLARAIFSAKEAAYKCQYPLTQEMFGFETIEIDMKLEEGRFSARFTGDVGPFRRDDRLAGRIRLAGGHIASLVTLR